MFPRVIVFNGVSLDARLDFGSGKIDMGLYYQLAASWNADAMLSGSNTLLAAIPPEMTDDQETYTPPAEYHPLAVPLLVVVDSRGRIRRWNYFCSQPFWRKIVVLCSSRTPQEYIDSLAKWRIEAIVAGDEHVDYRAAFLELNQRFGVKTLRVDSGGELNGVLLRAGLVDEVSVLLDPCLVGGETPRSFFVANDLTSKEGVIPLQLIHLERLQGDVIWLRYEVLHA